MSARPVISSLTFASLERSFCTYPVNTSQLGVRIPSHLNDQLKSYVAQTGISKTEVVISALASYLGCAEDIPLTERVASLEERMAVLEALVKTT